jgi:hypothetical protein
MSHVLDDLELYALEALPAERMTEVAAHLRGCDRCRAASEELAEVVASLVDAVPPRDPPADLKERIIAAAAKDASGQRRAVRLPRIGLDPRILALAAAIALLLGLDANQAMRLQAVEAERAEMERIAVLFAGGGRTWYMAGVGEWQGMGGNLMQPASGKPAFVVFHDLKALSAGQVYALWLIAPDGKWVRGTSFRPEGRDVQMVEVGQELAGFEQCAVTVETSTTGKRQGPLVMQSRIVPPSR